MTVDQLVKEVIEHLSCRGSPRGCPRRAGTSPAPTSLYPPTGIEASTLSQLCQSRRCATPSPKPDRLRALLQRWRSPLHLNSQRTESLSNLLHRRPRQSLARDRALPRVTRFPSEPARGQPHDASVARPG